MLPPFSLLSKGDGSPAGSRLARPDVRRADTRRGGRGAPPAGPAPGVPYPRRPDPGPPRVTAELTATKPEEEAMNTRMTILLPRRDALSAAADSGLARTRRQNSAENRGRHRAQRSLRVRPRRSGSLPPGPQLKAQRLPAAGRGSGERGGGGSWVRGMMGNVVSVPPWSGRLPELIQVASNYCASVPFAHRWLEGSGRQGKACNKRWRGCWRHEEK